MRDGVTLLLKKMEKYGISGVELKLFEDYLSNRLQYVTYDNHKSSHENINCGVPQVLYWDPYYFYCISVT